MRYAQGGGLTDAERTTGERLRLQIVGRFESGQKNAETVAALRISLRSVERWRRAWREGGGTGVLSKGPPGRPRLSEAQIARLEREFERSAGSGTDLVRAVAEGYHGARMQWAALS